MEFLKVHQLYFSYACACAMIGLFGGPYFTVQPAKLKILF